MGRYLTVAAAQMGPGSEDKVKNVQRMLALVEEAARRSVDFIGFVELALTPFFPAKLLLDYDYMYEEQMPSPLVEPLFRAAREASMGMVLPYAEKDLHSRRYYNSAIVVDSDGEILGKYRKTHLPGGAFPLTDPEPGSMEKRYFQPGDLGLPVFASTRKQAKIGVAICFDRRFPEVSRCLAIKGAEVVFMPYNTRGKAHLRGDPVDRDEVLLRARASENFLYVVGVGRAGVYYGQQFTAGSLIAEAGTGDVLAMATTDGDELISATVDLDEVTEERQSYRGFCERRPELYRCLAEYPY